MHPTVRALIFQERQHAARRMVLAFVNISCADVESAFVLWSRPPSSASRSEVALRAAATLACTWPTCTRGHIRAAGSLGEGRCAAAPPSRPPTHLGLGCCYPVDSFYVVEAARKLLEKGAEDLPQAPLRRGGGLVPQLRLDVRAELCHEARVLGAGRRAENVPLRVERVITATYTRFCASSSMQ